jgi:hypothetical protein
VRNVNTLKFLSLRGGTDVQWDADKLADKRRMRSVALFSNSEFVWSRCPLVDLETSRLQYSTDTHKFISVV